MWLLQRQRVWLKSPQLKLRKFPKMLKNRKLVSQGLKMCRLKLMNLTRRCPTSYLTTNWGWKVINHHLRQPLQIMRLNRMMNFKIRVRLKILFPVQSVQTDLWQSHLPVPPNLLTRRLSWLLWWMAIMLKQAPKLPALGIHLRTLGFQMVGDIFLWIK